MEHRFGMAFGAHFHDFGSLLGSLLETMLVTFGVPFLHRFFDPLKTSKNGGGALAVLSPSWVEWTRSPPSSDSSPLVKPLRVLIPMHRTPRQSQSFSRTTDICPISTTGICSVFTKVFQDIWSVPTADMLQIGKILKSRHVRLGLWS